MPFWNRRRSEADFRAELESHMPDEAEHQVRVHGLEQRRGARRGSTPQPHSGRTDMRRAAIVLLLGSLACRPSHQAPSDASGPAARALDEWVRAYNSGNEDSLLAFTATRYAASELALRPPDVIVQGHRLWQLNYGRFEVGRVEGSSLSVEAPIRETATDAFGRLYVDVDSSPPHGITGVYLTPFTRPPADWKPPTIRDDAELGRLVDEYATSMAERDLFSGALLVRVGGKTVLAKAYGLADRARSVPNDTATRFEVASLSKLFTAVAIMRLVERGSVRLDATVASLLPDYPNAGVASRITVAHLLMHTSGLADYYRNGKIRQLTGARAPLKAYWPLFANDSLTMTPGSAFDYSNSNYTLLGAIIESVSGRPFEQHVRENVFVPAEMTSTCYCDIPASRWARPHSRYTAGFGPGRRASPDAWITVPDSSRRPSAPAGGGMSTVGDLAAFGDAILRHRLVSASTLATMIEPRVAMAEDESKGYGFDVINWRGTKVIGHGGNFRGVMSQLDLYPASGAIVVVLANGDASGGEAIRNRTRNLLSAF